MSRFIFHTLVYSIIAGIFLGLLMKWMQYVTGYKIYTLLMNVDYIPIVKEYTFPEWVEFTFHLIIAVILTYVIVWIAWKKSFTSKQLISFTVIVNIVIAIALYPTTALSDRTPPLLSVPSFGLWLVAHIAYGVVLGILLARLVPTRLKNRREGAV
ncbi:hypothetical protein AAGS61_12965 [Lysinibacillus sp. KU-BSD001]|uniref:hypothetical protein n=1 Tax=Lysinibacillus sp. KU-BSD001 TaxID=3141328 RepID=UPI0036E0380B